MEIVSIEVKTFERMKETVELICRKMQKLRSQYQSKQLDEWLDNQDVCLFLNISPRTLQTLRSNGTLSFTQIERKLYYKKRDIIQLLENGKSKYNKK